MLALVQAAIISILSIRFVCPVLLWLVVLPAVQAVNALHALRDIVLIMQQTSVSFSPVKLRIVMPVILRIIRYASHAILDTHYRILTLRVLLSVEMASST
jgi:hypothetical protein